MVLALHSLTQRGVITGLTALTLVSFVTFLLQQYRPVDPITAWEHFGERDVVRSLYYIPPLGLGTWQIPKSKTAEVVQFALENGYRHLDAALIYGNEKEVGEGIAAAQVPRSSLWVTGKLWNNAHRPSEVRPALKQTLRDLGLDYLDLYLMHWPIAFEPGSIYNTVIDPHTSLRQTWAAMEDLVREGLVRQIGISNFNQAQAEQILLHAAIPPTVHEFECHLYLQQTEFVKWNLERGLRVIAFSPLGNMNQIYNSSHTPLLEDDSLVRYAKGKGLTVAQLALAWNMHRGVVVIPKSEHVARVAENFHAQSVHLTREDMVNLQRIDEKQRFNNPSTEWGVHLYSGLDGA
ncbi:putative dihydrodiol dehydrogenase [Aspergillus indologenus CBS 114.80]|uniref:D-xylose reductase [NAD(P)H] n=1 Tax=Aspergillus indologenus CBS 114.80 TaxID=1450541 RepID=A0A2V5IHX3_9EURO|nr:putative dihydrodiol dehydrogenase [Aspergillus indologenus CBS 114.80]